MKILVLALSGIGDALLFTPALKLLRKKYDTSISVYPSNRIEYNIINFLIGAKKRAGIKYLRSNNRNLGFLNNIRVKENDSAHNVQTNIKLVEKLLNKDFTEEPSLEFPLITS